MKWMLLVVGLLVVGLGGCGQGACVHGTLASGSQQCGETSPAECEKEDGSTFYEDVACEDLVCPIACGSVEEPDRICENGGWRAADEECPDLEEG